jgi:AraC-like DNA-binding protein
MNEKVSSWAHHLKDWNGNFQAQVLFRSFFANFLNLECYLIPADNFNSWQVIHALYEKSLAVDYERVSPVIQSRFEYNRKAFRTVIRSCQPYCAPHLSTYGLFVPIVESGKCTAILQTGIFLRTVPTEPILVRNWKKLTGTYPKPMDNEFLKYVQVVLEAPILGFNHVERLQQALQWYGELLTGQKKWKTVLEFFKDCHRFFSKEFPHLQWLHNVLVENKFFRHPAYARKLMDWEAEELDLSRFPTAVLAVRQESSGQELPDLLNARKLQNIAFKTARQMGNLFSTPLSHYGSILITSPPDNLSPSQQKTNLKETALLLEHQLSQKLKARVFIGIGYRLRPTMNLMTSYNEAVTALHLAELQKQSVLFFEDLKETPLPSFSSRHFAKQLVDFILENGNKGFPAFKDNFISRILKLSARRPESVRRIFLETIHRMAEAIEGWHTIASPLLDQLEKDIEDDFDAAYRMNELIDRFEKALNRLIPLLNQPYKAEKQIRIQKAQQILEMHPEKNWTLPILASQFGFSISSFSKEFSRFTGLPFSEYLLNQRINKSKRLLLGRSLPLDHIAQICGFSTTNYFFQVFKKKVGQSPRKYQQSGVL